MVSCENIFVDEKNWLASEYYIHSINPDGTENEEIVQLDFYPGKIEVSSDGQKLLAYGSDQYLFINLINNTINPLNTNNSNHYPKPTFSHDSSKLVFTKQNKLMLHDIYINETDSLICTGVDGYAVFSPNDEYIIFTTSDVDGSNYLKSLKRIKTDGSGLITLFSYINDSYPRTTICSPIFSSTGKLYFIANGTLHNINLDGSNHQDFNIEMKSKSIDISPNGDLIIGIDSYDYLLLISFDGMDFYPLYSGENAKFISNQRLVYSKSNVDLRVGEWDGSESNKLIRGRFPTYCDLMNKIYYLHVKEIYE
ncbi:MAG: hypothetical protein DRI23_13655 [Candidatus Cloacimonadota bacterium]|nr:MAG: hypothetical protein DRI23_13655 [Candidatus Cloacimonadota bacterium]